MPHSMTGIILKLLPSICTGNDTWVKRREGYTGCQLPSRTLETPLSCDLWTWTATLASKSHISMPPIGKWLQGRLIKTSERPARMWARSHWQRLRSHWQLRGEEKTLKSEEFNPRRPEKLVAGMFLSQRTNQPQTHPPLQHFARIYSTQYAQKLLAARVHYHVSPHRRLQFPVLTLDIDHDQAEPEKVRTPRFPYLH